MVRWAVIVAIAAAACGGNSKRQGGDARDQEWGHDSEEALRDLRAFPDVPDDSVLIHARSDPTGIMDAKGRSNWWLLLLLSPSEKSTWVAQVVDNTAQVFREDVDRADCLAALPIPAPPGSGVLVPEMENRYAPLDPFPETIERWTARLYHVEHPCLSPSAYNRVSAIRSNPETDETYSFHYDYSWEGTLLAACEGCGASARCCD